MIAFIAGMFIGSAVGFLAAAVCCASGRSDGPAPTYYDARAHESRYP